VNLSHPRVLQLVADSLRYWATEMRVDGFRFDLATILAREPYGFDEGGGFLDACRQDPVLSSVKLIASPGHRSGRLSGRSVSAGMGGVERQVQGQRAHFLEGRRGIDRGLRQARVWIRRSLQTSADAGHGPASTSSPPMTFQSQRSRLVQRQGTTKRTARTNRDGHSNNHSWNCGVEGPTNDPEITSLRGRQKCNLLATMLLSHGTPMLLAGDEFGHTQNGNNNAYAQDNETTWLNWMGISANGATS